VFRVPNRCLLDESNIKFTVSSWIQRNDRFFRELHRALKRQDFSNRSLKLILCDLYARNIRISAVLKFSKRNVIADHCYMDEIYKSKQTTRRFVVAPRIASIVSINDSSELNKLAFWSILVLMIRLTINCATSAECVIGLWIRRFIAMVPTAKYTVEVPFV